VNVSETTPLPCTASYSFAGDANHTGSSGSATLTITKAASTTTLLGTGTFVYDTNPHPASATVTGVGGLNQAVPVVYSGNCSAAPVNVNDTPCTVTATYPGDANHYGSSTTGTITITKASQAITVTTHAPGTIYLNSSFVLAATGGGSGNPVTFGSSGACTNVGPTFTMNSVGTCTVTYDQAGNNNYYAAPQVVEYTTVIYNFTGFFRPVDNLGVWNVVKAGSAVPVKFSLNGYQGLGIMATSSQNGQTYTYPTSGPILCDSTGVYDYVDETVTAGGSSLTYDSTVGQYVYVWKTEKAWVGTCRQLVVKLSDGTYHRANFNFTK
jgi:hypothetical protein